MADITSLVTRAARDTAAAIEAILGSGKCGGGAVTNASQGSLVVTVPAGYKFVIGASGLLPADVITFNESVTITVADDDDIYIRRLPGGASFELASAASTPADGDKIADIDISMPTTPDLVETPSIGAAGVRSYIHVDLSVDQQFDLSAPSHLEFDRIVASSGDLLTSFGTGQALGRVTLAAGKIYRVRAGFTFLGEDGNSQLCCSIYNLTDDQVEGSGGLLQPMESIGDPLRNHSNECIAYVDARDADKQIECRILSGGGVTSISTGTTNTGPTWMTAEEL